MLKYLVILNKNDYIFIFSKEEKMTEKCMEIFKNGKPCPAKVHGEGRCVLHFNKWQKTIQGEPPYLKCIAVSQRTGIPCKKKAIKGKIGELCETHNSLKEQKIFFETIPDRNKEYFEHIEKKIKNEEKNYKICRSSSHTFLISEHPKERVPISLFKKNSDDLNSRECTTCIACRTYERKKLVECKELALQVNNDEFRICTTKCHEAASQYPRNNVPTRLFWVDSSNPQGEKFINCQDCRTYINNNKKKSIKNKIENLKEEEFFCPQCFNIFNNIEIPSNLDGTQSSVCLHCKDKQTEAHARRKKEYRDMLYDTILKNNCSCSLCECIFLKPIDGTGYVVTLETYVSKKIKYLKYQGIRYKASDFLIQYKELLELLILEFDHLTEVEQRQRGLLKTDEDYEPKKASVSKLCSTKTRLNEIKKTQLICCKCHIIETLRREEKERNGEPQQLKPLLEREKTEYINEVKSQGCSSCHFYDKNLLRFLEFDHINPQEKITEICRMKMLSSYSLQDLIDEIKKCRILCRHCHKIHTANQIKEGIL
jgi:hypothetical protein